MEEKKVLLDVKNLRTSFFTEAGEVKSVNDVSFHVNEREVVAVVGESGSGKSVTQLSVLQLIQSPPGKILGGEVWFEGENLLTYSKKQMCNIRGKWYFHDISGAYDQLKSGLYNWKPADRGPSGAS